MIYLLAIYLICIITMFILLLPELCGSWLDSMVDHYKQNGITKPLLIAFSKSLWRLVLFLVFSPYYLFRDYVISKFIFRHQNLKNNLSGSLVHFRGSISLTNNRNKYIRYEFLINKKIRFDLNLELDKSEGEILTNTSFLFVTIYLRFPKKFKNYDNRKFGFSFYNFCSDYIFTWNWNVDPDSFSSKTPKYKHIYLVLNDVLFGQVLVINTSISDWKDRYFSVRGKEYKMDSIELTKAVRFRSRIPYFLYNKSAYYIEFKITNPPEYSGKWGDDGSYGLSRLVDNFTMPDDIWKHDTREKYAQLFLFNFYIENFKDNLRRYGRASHDRELPSDVIDFHYIGVKSNLTPKEHDNIEVSILGFKEQLGGSHGSDKKH